MEGVARVGLLGCLFFFWARIGTIRPIRFYLLMGKGTEDMQVVDGSAAGTHGGGSPELRWNGAPGLHLRI